VDLVIVRSVELFADSRRRCPLFGGKAIEVETNGKNGQGQTFSYVFRLASSVKGGEGRRGAIADS